MLTQEQAEMLWKKLTTLDEDACFESVRKDTIRHINKDIKSGKLMTQEEYICSAVVSASLFCTTHLVPYAFHTNDFILTKYPNLYQRIRSMVEAELNMRK